MPQINDTTGNIKTSSIVRVDAKFESVNFKAIPRGTVDISEGCLMIRNASGVADVPVAGSRQVYINFSNPNAPQVKDAQKINIAGGTLFSVDLSSGGYAGIVGAQTRIGLPKTSTYFVTADVAGLAVADRLTLKADVADSNKVKLSILTNLATELCFGVVDQIETGAGITIAWFLFSSVGYRVL